MEVGRIADIEKSQVNHIQKIEKVQEIDEKYKVDPNEQYKNQQRSEKKEENEVILDNVHFGYNPKSQEFFVKIVKNNIESKYPSDDMMRIKAQMLDIVKNMDEVK